jgi:hypothetical protein
MSRRPRPWVAVSLAVVILVVAGATGALGRGLRAPVAGWGSFGWPALVAGRWWTLPVSLVLTRDRFMALSMAAAVAGVLGAYERRAGHLRAAAVAAVGHGTGSVVVATAAGALGRTGWPVAVRAAENLDYGASMVVAGALGALVAHQGDRRLVRLAAAGIVVALVAHHQLADWAHLVAAPAGFLADRARRPRWAAVAVAATGVLTAWLLVDGSAAVVEGTDAIRFPPVPAPTAASAVAARGRVVRLAYRSPALGDRYLMAWVYVPAARPGPAGLPVALLLHGIPGAPDDWLAGGDVAGALDRAVAGGSAAPALAVIPDGEGMHDPAAGWADVAGQRLLTSVTRDLLGAVARRWPVDLEPGRMAVIGVGRGATGAARLSRQDARIGFVAGLDPPSRLHVRPGVHVLATRSGDDAGAPGRAAPRWRRWRVELPGVLAWLHTEGFGTGASAV